MTQGGTTEMEAETATECMQGEAIERLSAEDWQVCEAAYTAAAAAERHLIEAHTVYDGAVAVRDYVQSRLMRRYSLVPGIDEINAGGVIVRGAARKEE